MLKRLLKRKISKKIRSLRKKYKKTKKNISNVLGQIDSTVSPNSFFREHNLYSDEYKTYRDTLQKVFWVNKCNPNAKKLRIALQTMLEDKQAVADITKKVGVYDWFIGDDYKKMLTILNQIKTKNAVKDLVWFQKNVLGYDAVIK